MDVSGQSYALAILPPGTNRNTYLKLFATLFKLLFAAICSRAWIGRWPYLHENECHYNLFVNVISESEEVNCPFLSDIMLDFLPLFMSVCAIEFGFHNS